MSEPLSSNPDLDRAKQNARTAERLMAELRKANAEIERLTAELETARAYPGTDILGYKAERDRLRAAGKRALDEMVRTAAPRDSFTEAVDQLDAALAGAADETTATPGCGSAQNGDHD